MPDIGAVRQIALSAGRDLDATLAFWRDVLGMILHARYDPPGIAFIMAVRCAVVPAACRRALYLDSGLVSTPAKADGVPFTTPPTLVHAIPRASSARQG